MNDNPSEAARISSSSRVDMSPEAIAARLQQLSELYDLSLMLQSAKKVDQSGRLPESTAQTRHVDQGDPAST